MTDAPERHKDTARNLIINKCVADLDDIINDHDPEVDVPIKDGVWDRLDKMALEIADAAVLAEREKWLEALTPSAETKAAYIGEFMFPASYFDEYGDEQTWGLNVPWATIKEIMKAIRARTDTEQEGK